MKVFCTPPQLRPPTSTHSKLLTTCKNRTRIVLYRTHHLTESHSIYHARDAGQILHFASLGRLRRPQPQCVVLGCFSRQLSVAVGCQDLLSFSFLTSNSICSLWSAIVISLEQLVNLPAQLKLEMGHPLDSFSDPNTCHGAVVVAVGALHVLFLHIGPHQGEANGRCSTCMPARFTGWEHSIEGPFFSLFRSIWYACKTRPKLQMATALPDSWSKRALLFWAVSEMMKKRLQTLCLARSSMHKKCGKYMFLLTVAAPTSAEWSLFI